MIYIGIPTYDGKMHHSTVAGLVNTAWVCGKSGIGYAVDVVPHDAFIGRARNLIAMRFLASGFQDLMFIDADVGFTADAVVAVGKAPVDIACGLYRMKIDKEKYPAAMVDPIERHPEDPHLLKMQYGPTGFMRIKRQVLLDMIEKYPDEWYSDDNGKMYDFFPHGRFGNSFIGEDIKFCQRAQACGYDVWAVQNLGLAHTGEKTYPSNWRIDIQVPEEKAA